jgi:hypothetical protein
MVGYPALAWASVSVQELSFQEVSVQEVSVQVSLAVLRSTNARTSYLAFLA